MLAGGRFYFGESTQASTKALITPQQLSDSWYSDQPGLSPSQVSGGHFGQQFNTPVDGQIYAKPEVQNGVLFIGTETNNIYGINASTGAQLWTRKLGTPFDPSILKCADISPTIGVTSTPAIDPATNTAYFTSAANVNGAAFYYMYAVNIATGADRPGFPVTIQGTAANAPTHTFTAKTELQRPALLLMNGVVYAAFGGHCDRKPYEGWIIGVSTAGKITTLWTDQAGTDTATARGGGIWQSGGGLVSDGDGQILFSTSNGVPPAASTLGNANPSNLAQSLVRLTVQPGGSLKSTDFFSPYDADLLNLNDSDFGSGGPVGLPQQYFGTPAYPHLMIADGKQGYIYMLNADNLGGRGGAKGPDAVINRIGPNGGLWSSPALWPGGGGYIYTTTAQGGKGSGALKAYHYSLDGTGKPTLSLVGTSPDAFGFGSSSPVVTSDGLTTGSALVWTIWEPNMSGSNGQLRAYNAVPAAGKMQMVYSAPIGTANKFTPTGIYNNHVYVGTRDGHVLCFGAPVNNVLSGSPLDLGTVIVGNNAVKTETLTAGANVTITNIASTNPAFTVGSSTPALPATLTAGQTIQIPIMFAPTTPCVTLATLTITTSGGTVSFGLSGNGVSATAQLAVAPTSLDFGQVAVGSPTTTTSATFTNVGATPLTVTGVSVPQTPFSISGQPTSNLTLQPNGSFTVTVGFAPTVVGTFKSAVTVTSTAGTVSLPLTGVGATAPKLVVTPLNVKFGIVAVGKTVTQTFTVANTGGSPLTITRSKPPIAGVGFTATSSLAEGTVIPPGTKLTETVKFTPKSTKKVNDSWSLNGDDGGGVQNVVFSGS
ncbi:MAG: hypothetical protein PVSMB5_06100 [Ktedonobacteraceae bacterium]